VSVTTEEVSAEAPTDKLSVDAHILLSEQHLMAVRSGDLNPQVGMLTEKIKVRGKVSPAVYIFNLIAPRSRS
jgi:putative sterol carrier protein